MPPMYQFVQNGVQKFVSVKQFEFSQQTNMAIHNAVETLQNNADAGLELLNKLQGDNKLLFRISENTGYMAQVHQPAQE
jgi:hypothetical protein